MIANQTLYETALLPRFQAVAEETCFEIVGNLADGERCVCELQDERRRMLPLLRPRFFWFDKSKVIDMGAL